MHVIQPQALTALMSAIVNATHGLTDTAGDRQSIGTIDSLRLRTAALVALQIATGETIFPGDETLVIAEPKAPSGVLRVERR